MKNYNHKRIIASMTVLLLLMVVLSASATAAPRAASSFAYSVTESKNNTGIVAFASVLSNCTESFMNLNVVLQQYKNGNWERYSSYNSYVTNTSTCYVSESANAPRGYHYRVAVSFSSSSIPGVGPYYSSSFYW